MNLAAESPSMSSVQVSGNASLGGAAHIAPIGLRRYPRDSAHAAARIVALALMANGRIKSVEAATLDAVEAHAWLGIERHEWYAVLGQLRLDLLQHVRSSRGFSISDAALERLLDDVGNEELRRVVAALSVAVIHADRRVALGEQAFLAALERKWSVPVHPEAGAPLLRERALARSGSAAPGTDADVSTPPTREAGLPAGGDHAGMLTQRQSAAATARPPA